MKRSETIKLPGVWCEKSRRCGDVDRASQENNFLVGSAGELKSIGRLQRAGCSPRRDCLSAEYGQSDVEAGKAFADDTIVRAFSMTKPITTVAAMMLYEEGAFQLDDPIASIPAGVSQTRRYGRAVMPRLKIHRPRKRRLPSDK